LGIAFCAEGALAQPELPDISSPQVIPSAIPSETPSASPSELPSALPSATPSVLPSIAPSEMPSPASSPAVRKTPSFTGFHSSAVLRAYDFLRQNRVQGSANPNRQAENNSAMIRVGYGLKDTPFSLGATYFGAYAFGLNGASPQFNPHVDNTLPGFSESTLLEAYVKYATDDVHVTVGNQIGSKPWLPASDSRLKPVAYQGVDASARIAPGLSLGVSRFIRWEGRDQSAFDRSTLFTSQPAGNPAFPTHDTAGSLLLDLTYKPHDRLSVSLQHYTFYDIANMTYAYGTYAPMPHSRYRPFVMMQYVREKNVGASYAGIIDNTTLGLEIGGTLARNLTGYIAYNSAPTLYADVPAASAAAAVSGFLAPVGGSTNAQSLGGGMYRVGYGGLASPYTFNYATDPLFTSSISQGMADRISGGTAMKVGLTYTNNSKQLKALLSQAYYDYSNIFAPYRAAETDVDVTYYLRKPAEGPYRGLFLRERVADRTQSSAPFDFKYIRSQIEYDF
jgi:hypothetical protein